MALVKQNHWRGIGLIIKALETHIERTKKIFLGRAGDKYFLHPLARKTEALFFLSVDKISELCCTSESSSI